MKEILKPILVLALICLVVTATLAAVNQRTQPVIQAAEEAAAAAARSEVLPNSTEFQKIQLSSLPEGVTEVYRGSEGTGYVILAQAKGYGGPIKIICGIRPNGTLAAVKTLSHSETNGVGTKVVDNNADYRKRFTDTNQQTYTGIDAVTGATVSSNGYRKAIGAAFEAFRMIKEAEHENAQ